MAKSFLNTVILGFAVLLLAPAWAQCAPASCKTLVLGCPPQGWPPYYLLNEKGQCDGIMPSILTTAAKAAGLRVTCRMYPEKRAMRKLESGEIDVFCKAKAWVNRPERFAWNQEGILSADVLVSRKDAPIRFDEFSDLKGKRIGTVLGFVYPTLEKMFQTGEILRDDAPSAHEQILKVLRKRTDAAVVNQLVAQWILATTRGAPPGELTFSKRPVAYALYRFVFTRAKDWQPSITRIDEEIRAMRQDGRLDAILARYR